ncbi:Tkp4 protein [Vanderwaltozyma polyspora DSM 70294]|uniref:Tkp4 protein n=1 Tax=Vanderwaltozyma polyspora (strain ATCC 22028 / DSM 70294 / BCRC 21397 / CBS 2163 / NBRC 10782 / NRRL Y-8283 / UCD 57-17) TaxID=436907 RepID=A7TRJ5_VANPO|nr:Tkp4 protein [Vanderwaltozyma polyspora DSM 70294]EDO15124.1 Tkp4 protein [Vanderwaltozyma polyspora DSM 70294]
MKSHLETTTGQIYSQHLIYSSSVVTLIWTLEDKVTVTIAVFHTRRIFRFLSYIKGTNFQLQCIKLFMLYRLLCYKMRIELPPSDLGNRSRSLFDVYLLIIKLKISLYPEN